MRVYIIGHSGLTTRCSSVLNHDDARITSTSTISTKEIDMAPAFTYECVTGAQEEQAKVLAEDKYYHNLALEEIREGWLKPHKQLKPFSKNTRINYNLPRSRLREKKEIFLLKAA